MDQHGFEGQFAHVPNEYRIWHSLALCCHVSRVKAPFDKFDAGRGTLEPHLVIRAREEVLVCLLRQLGDLYCHCLLLRLLVVILFLCCGLLLIYVDVKLIHVAVAQGARVGIDELGTTL